MPVFGYDASNHDWGRRKVSLADVRKAGISLMTHKATEGNWYQDPYFPKFAKQNPGRFPVAGSYHVLNHGINVNAQTDYWHSYVSQHYRWTAHPCWLWQIDAEALDGYKAPTLAEIKACGKRLEAKGIPAARIAVYAPGWHYGDSLDGLPYPLWQSNYGSNPQADYRDAYPGDDGPGWAKYSGQIPTVWQFGSRTRIGKQPTCDANAIRVANEHELQALFGGGDDMPSKKQIADAVLGSDTIPVADAPKSNPTWTLRSWAKWQRVNVLKLIKGQNAQDRVLADLVKRVAALQKSVADLSTAQAQVKLEPAKVSGTLTFEEGK